jgi:hypothetical protein
MEYVYGYRSDDCRNNLRYTANDRLVYHTSSIAVVMTLDDSRSQEYFLQHTDDIVCLDGNGDIFITGQVGKNPLICIWQATSSGTVLRQSYQNLVQNGVGRVCLSQDCRKFAVASLGKKQKIFVQDVFPNQNI